MKKWSLCVVLLQSLYGGILPVYAHPIDLNVVQVDTSSQQSPEADTSAQPDSETSEMKSFNELIEGAEVLEGLFKLYHDPETGKLYAAIAPEQLNQNYLYTATLESGIGEAGLYSGLPLEDFLFYFRQVHNKLHFVVRNVHFRAQPNDPAQKSINRLFSDSVLHALDIKSTHPETNTLLVDLGPLLLSDLAGVKSILSEQIGSAYKLDRAKSHLGSIKAFPLNLEIQTIYGFSNQAGESTGLRSLPDDRAFSLRVHYSLSKLPEGHGYRPRLADNRVGYFIIAHQDLSLRNQREPFVRYIKRWHLAKQDPTAPLSPPQEPIVFWIENTFPVEYRDAVREGVLMWNRAFEQAGFSNAIEVRQMPDDADWDPADIRYNTLRWVNSFDGAFALGPSRANPLTGQILDADILIDAGLLKAFRRSYRGLKSTASGSALSPLATLSTDPTLCISGLHQPQASDADPESASHQSQFLDEDELCLSAGAHQQFAIGSLALALFEQVEPESVEMQQFINQFLRWLVAHEVGHTLGLRHNFRGSTWLQPEELNDPEITRTRGLVGSVMDYTPINLAPPGTPQGDYFTSVVGPYDEWAIAYGYKPLSATTPASELPALRKIAQRAPEAALAYATDEDSYDGDPSAIQYDLSADPLRYARWQMDNAQEMWRRLEHQPQLIGESYSELSNRFDIVFDYYTRHAAVAVNYIGGKSFYRDHVGDPEGRIPFAVVPLAQQQAALDTLATYVFSQDAFQFSPDLLNKLAPPRWRHWGSHARSAQLDYPIHNRIFSLQKRILRSLLARNRLTRLRDFELKTAPGQTLILPELFATLQTMIWTELTQPDAAGNISSLRRAVQHEHMDLLINMVLRVSNVPEDARTLAWYQLRQLRQSIDKTIKKRSKMLDIYTRAHLEAASDRITKALEADLRSNL
ncbi:MAG: DUF5117 domain-containing protein [Cyanothece sp. SIO1E1]|nr:DUF5117 domain-containing protein [Cyanothece sp. SIO1E1]